MVKSDRASEALAQRLPSGARETYAALSEQSGVALTTIFHREKGRPSLEQKAQGQQYLTVAEEKALVTFLLLLSNFGQPVRVKYIPSLAFCIARQRSNDPSNNATEPPNKNWPRSFEKRHPVLKARRARPIDWKRHDKNIYHKITEWFRVIREVLDDPAILPENVYNMDETGVMLSMLGSVKVLVGKDDSRNYRGVGIKRTMVTAVECISADGRSLLPLIIWPASTHRDNWTKYKTPGWHYGHSENGYNDSKVILEWFRRVFDPQTRDRANDKPRVLICDGFGTHETLEVLDFCFQNNIILCRLPSHTSHKLQPCDVGVFAPLKTAYRDQVERLYRKRVETVEKGHFTSLYDPARQTAFTKRNITAAWAASGLFPFNPDRVLRSIPEPPAELPVRPPAEPRPEAVESNPQEALKSPITPTTPVTTDALMSLHNLIKRDACGLDEPRKKRLERHVQKLASAAHISFAKQTLLQAHNGLLIKHNNESKVRRSTRSVVLGKAKVMSYEDLEDARAKRAEKEKAAADKAKVKLAEKGKAAADGAKVQRGRKRKSSAQEEASPAPRAKLARTGEVLQQAERLWTAPVARMYSEECCQMSGKLVTRETMIKALK